VSTAQSFLFFLILLGVAATALRLLSRTTPTVPYPVLLAVGGILIGLVPGLRLPPIGPDLILLAFVPGLVFEASLAVDLDEMWRRVVPISLLATLGVFLTVVLIGALAHYGLGLDWAGGFLLGAIVAATDPIAVVQLLRQVGAPRGLEAILDGESLFNDGTGVAVFSAVLGTILSGHPSLPDAGLRFLFVTVVGVAIGAAAGTAIGAAAGGGKGAAIGAAAGAAAGVGTVMATRGKPAEIPVEARISFRLEQQVVLTEQAKL